MRMSISQSPEGRRILPLTPVLENLQMVAAALVSAHFYADLDRVFGLLP